MKQRFLGNTGIRVSELGFGCWGIGGPVEGSAMSYGSTDDRISLAALEHAFERGITFYDTAPSYGNGHSEELIGKALAGVRKDVILASKVGFEKLDRGGIELSNRAIRESVEKSLERLRTDYLDLLYLHGVVAGTLRSDPAIIATLQDLKSEGLIRACGISLQNMVDGLAIIDEWKFDVMQLNFNLIDQRPLELGIVKHASEKGIGLVARTPLSFGFLTGKVPAGPFDPSDHRSRWPAEQILRWREAPKFFEPLAAVRGSSVAELALQFCVSYASFATAIAGMMTPAEVDENVRAFEKPPLTPNELLEVERIYRANRFF